MQDGMDMSAAAFGWGAVPGMMAEPRRTPQPPLEDDAVAGRYKKMYDRASALARIGVWEYELSTGRLTWTDGVYDLFELPRGCFVDRAMALAFYEEGSRREMERLRAEAIGTGGSFSLDIQVRTARGNRRWLRLTCDAEQENGRTVRIFGAKQDITEMKEAQARVCALQSELIQLSRRSAMGATVATLAHDLNQPLTAITNYAAGARRLLRKPDVEQQSLEEGLLGIAENAHRAGDLIRRMRDATGGSVGRREKVLLAPLVRDAARLAMARAPDGVVLKLAVEEHLALSADPDHIEHAVLNLLHNALDALHGSPQGEIALAVFQEGDWVEVCIEDSGPGIDPDISARLFDSLSSSRQDRMGMGLSISRTIVEAHGGTIHAGTAPGRGARFCVRLPLSSNPEAYAI
jgi:C4-dicarboxylate-specific signal transduction histidine kinase